MAVIFKVWFFKLIIQNTGLALDIFKMRTWTKWGALKQKDWRYLNIFCIPTIQICINNAEIWFGTRCEISLWWKPLNTFGDKLALIQVMAWCCQATNHYLSQSWSRSISPYDITRPQWVKKLYWCQVNIDLRIIDIREDSIYCSW